MLIAIEGIPASGKSMQAQLFSAWLKGRAEEVTISGEPTRGKWGKMIKHSLSRERLDPQKELQLHINDRREHVEVVIKPALARNDIVIIDGYYYSNTAFAAMRGFGPLEVLKLNESFAPKPDLVLLIDIDPKTALERIGKGGPNTQTLEELTKMRAVIRELALNQDRFTLANGTLDPRNIQDQLRARYTAMHAEQNKPDPSLPSLVGQDAGPNATCAACGALSERVALMRTRKCEWCGAPWSP